MAPTRTPRSSAERALPFTKLHGLGNDFILWDGLDANAPSELVHGWTPSVAFLQKICDRRFGVGCDQILWLKKMSATQTPATRMGQAASSGATHGSAAQPVAMEILNADGTHAEMCGNGLRAAILYLWLRGPEPHKIHYPVMTAAGLMSGEVVVTPAVSSAVKPADAQKSREPSPSREALFSAPPIAQCSATIRVNMGAVQKLTLAQTLDLTAPLVAHSHTHAEAPAATCTHAPAKTPHAPAPMHPTEHTQAHAQIASQMGLTPRFTEVSMGNPHAVFFTGDLPAPYNTLPLAQLPLEVWGPVIERHPRFKDRTNVEFVEITKSAQLDGVAVNLNVRVWERGAGLTLACGTGACASAVAAIAHQKVAPGPVTVTLPGGQLTIEWQNTPGTPVIMQGPAELVYDGQWVLP